MDKRTMKKIRKQVRSAEIRNDLDYANSQPNENELAMEKQLAWFNHFVDYVNQVDPNLYNEACEYSDNAEESV